MKAEIKVDVIRKFRGPDYTIGKMYLDGQYFCDTLEDTDRGLKKTDPLSVLKAKKKYGETAIPTGTYSVIINRSPKFGRDLPRLLEVPAYDGILIHAGNTAKDTLGCILVGENKVKGKVLNSRYWEGKLMERLRGYSRITITIR